DVRLARVEVLAAFALSHLADLLVQGHAFQQRLDLTVEGDQSALCGWRVGRLCPSLSRNENDRDQGWRQRNSHASSWKTERLTYAGRVSLATAGRALWHNRANQSEAPTCELHPSASRCSIRFC